MTAEITLLNKSAVALAADSAVSIQQGESMKIYNSMNKLFTLSKFAPMGVMVYGTAHLSGTPWETIIKLYRQGLNSKRFGTVAEYAQDFLEYVQTNRQYATESQQRDFFLGRSDMIYQDIYDIVS